jgi:PST family polysaccharide transporter
VAIQLVSTFVLARLLTPEAYGLVGMVTVVVAFAALFKDLGLSSATIQRESITSAQVTIMFWVNTCVGFFLSVLVALSAPLVVWFYSKPELFWITVALGFNILISSLGAQHSALLTRQMKFKQLAIVRLSSALGALIITCVAALAGFSHWALVAGAISASLIQTLALWIISPWCPGLPQRSTGASSMIRYGLNLTGFELVNFFSRNLDNILIGRFWGDAALGLYSRAYGLIVFPVNQIRTPLASVAMPALSRLQSDPVRFRNYYRKILFILALVCMPISSFIVVSAEPLIITVLGANWKSVAPLASWLAVAGFLQPVAGLFGAVLTARGLANRHFRCGLASALVLTFVFAITVSYGVNVLAMGYALSGYLLFIPIFLYASKDTGIHIYDFLRGIWRPAFSSIVSAFVLYVTIQFMRPLAPWIELMVLGVLHALVVVIFLLILPGGKKAIRELFHHLKSAFLIEKRGVA